MILQQLVPPAQFSCSTFLQFLLRSWYLSTFSFSFSPILLSVASAISTVHFLSCLFTTTMSGLLASMTWSRCMFTSHNSLTSSFSLTLSGACSYYLSLFSRWYFLHNVQWTAFVTLSCLLLYYYYPFGSKLRLFSCRPTSQGSGSSHMTKGPLGTHSCNFVDLHNVKDRWELNNRQGIKPAVLPKIGPCQLGLIPGSSTTFAHIAMVHHDGTGSTVRTALLPGISAELLPLWITISWLLT